MVVQLCWDAWGYSNPRLNPRNPRSLLLRTVKIAPEVSQKAMISDACANARSNRHTKGPQQHPDAESAEWLEVRNLLKDDSSKGPKSPEQRKLEREFWYPRWAFGHTKPLTPVSNPIAGQRHQEFGQLNFSNLQKSPKNSSTMKEDGRKLSIFSRGV